MKKVYYSINDTLCSAEKFYSKLLEFCVINRKGNVEFQRGMDLFIKNCIELDNNNICVVSPQVLNRYDIPRVNSLLTYQFKKIIVNVKNLK